MYSGNMTTANVELVCASSMKKAKLLLKHVPSVPPTCLYSIGCIHEKGYFD